MGFSKFEFRPIESFHYREVFGLDGVEDAGEGYSVFGSWSSVYIKFWVPRQFGAILDKYVIHKKKEVTVN
jgi:hypothetical protein